MDQVKIGAFLKVLRKEKGLTQEQLAEFLQLSNRTVSRWENGNNMPDLDVLIQLSDYYDIELRELLAGERKGEQMNQGLEETVLQAVDYTNAETARYTTKINCLLWVGVILFLASQGIRHTGLQEIYYLNILSDFAAGAACSLLLCGIVVTSLYGKKLKAWKQRLFKRQ